MFNKAWLRATTTCVSVLIRIIASFVTHKSLNLSGFMQPKFISYLHYGLVGVFLVGQPFIWSFKSRDSLCLGALSLSKSLGLKAKDPAVPETISDYFHKVSFLPAVYLGRSGFLCVFSNQNSITDGI